jgi:hypothetical protein
MASLSRELRRIKQDVRVSLPDTKIIEACKKAGHVWRERLLGPEVKRCRGRFLGSDDRGGVTLYKAQHGVVLSW